ncbi:MAG: glycosyltransferase family 39 protein [Opitutae bacterium]|nr:glycosyltransferase family 39 protein [Opitutae bacterium]
MIGGFPHSFSLARSEVRLAVFGASALLAVYLGFLGLGVGPASLVVQRYGYYVMLASVALWLWTLFRLWQQRAPSEPLTRGETISATAAIGLFSVLAVVSEPMQSKVLNDEFVLQSTAYNMHYFRETGTMVRGYELLGVFLSTDSYLDKRPYLYPFLVSLVHDLTGYRPANAFWLNALLYPVALGLIYYLGRRLAGRRGALLAVLLLGSLPLLGQNATGSGMELLNVVMILVVIGLGGAYLRQPDETRLAALVVGGVLLGQARYESALYVAPVAGIVALGWWRSGRIVLPWEAVVAPLLLVPMALQNKVLANSPIMWELKENQNTRFAFEYLWNNLRGAGAFLFSTTPMLANFFLLSVVGCLALAVCLLFLVRRPPPLRTANPDGTAWVLVGAAALINTVLVLFYYWARFDDPMASRFSLPLHLLLAFAAVWVCARWDRRWPASRWLIGATLVSAMGTTTARYAYHHYSIMGIVEIEWERRWVAQHPMESCLILTNKSSLPWLLQKTPAIMIDRARLVADRLVEHLKAGTFRQILVFQSMRPSTVEGDHQLVPEDRLPDNFHLTLLAERRFGTKLARISRLDAIDPPPPEKKTAPAVTPKKAGEK